MRYTREAWSRKATATLFVVGISTLALSSGCTTSSSSLHPAAPGLSGRCPEQDWTTPAAVSTPATIDPQNIRHLEELGLTSGASWMAAGLGLTPLIVERAALFERERGGDTESHLAALRLDQAVDRRVAIVGLDASALATTIDCEEERWDDLASDLERQRGKRNYWLTVAAIAAGTLTGIGAGVLDLADRDRAAAGVAIAGSASGALLGAATLLPGRRVEIVHQGSLLADLWADVPTSIHAPRPVWLFLTAPRPDGVSRRDSRRRALRTIAVLGPPGSSEERARQVLFFGGGGTMTVSDLRRYASMLNELESDVAGMHSELTKLLRELDVWRDQQRG